MCINIYSVYIRTKFVLLYEKKKKKKKSISDMQFNLRILI